MHVGPAIFGNISIDVRVSPLSDMTCMLSVALIIHSSGMKM